jgi:hypothetical protein
VQLLLHIGKRNIGKKHILITLSLKRTEALKSEDKLPGILSITAAEARLRIMHQTSQCSIGLSKSFPVLPMAETHGRSLFICE